MNNEKKYREIAKFCMKQKADENIAKEYEEYGMKDAMRASRICNRLRWILDPYSKRLVRMTFDVREDEGSNKEAKETVLKYINEGYKAPNSNNLRTVKVCRLFFCSLSGKEENFLCLNLR